MKTRDLERHLIAHGCTLARQAAKHEFWENAANGEHTTVPLRASTPLTSWLAEPICAR